MRRNLAEVTAELEYLRLLNWKVAWQVATKHLDVADSSSVKVYGTEFYTGRSGVSCRSTTSSAT